MDYCKSHLFEKESISCFFLSAIGLSIANSYESLTDLLKSTFLYVQNSVDSDPNILVNDMVSQLIESGAVKVVRKESQEELALSNLGKAATKGNI